MLTLFASVEWVPRGPLGVEISENNPFKRSGWLRSIQDAQRRDLTALRFFSVALNAFNQFLKSRETAIFTQHLVFIQNFRDHTGLFKPTHPVPHLPSGLEAWGGERNKKRISEWEEDCWFVRDMEGCLKAFWEGPMSRPGGDRLRVTVYDMFGESPQMLQM